MRSATRTCMKRWTRSRRVTSRKVYKVVKSKNLKQETFSTFYLFNSVTFRLPTHRSNAITDAHTSRLLSMCAAMPGKMLPVFS